MGSPWVFSIISGYDLPETYGPFDGQRAAVEAAHVHVTGEKFSPGGDWETLNDWYMATDEVVASKLQSVPSA